MKQKLHHLDSLFNVGGDIISEFLVSSSNMKFLPSSGCVLFSLHSTIMILNITLVPLCVDFTSARDYVLFVFHTMAGISTVLVAGSVVCGILNTRALLRQNRFIFMLNTSISDTMFGFGSFYQFLFDVREEPPVKNGTFYIVPSFLGVNIMTFIFAQFDRYLAVCHPFFYDRFVTIKVVICVNIYSWVHIYGLLLVQHIVPSKAMDIAVYSRISLLVIIVFKVSMTVKLLFVAKYQLLREPPGPERDSKKESLLIIILVVIFFLILWSPTLFFTVIASLIGRYTAFRNEAVNPMKVLSRSNTLCTPSLYLWASPSLRAAVWKTTWSKTCCCKTPKWFVAMTRK